MNDNNLRKFREKFFRRHLDNFPHIFTYNPNILHEKENVYYISDADFSQTFLYDNKTTPERLIKFFLKYLKIKDVIMYEKLKIDEIKIYIDYLPF